MPVATSFVSPPLGHSIPYLTPHAVSVSLPTWRDNVGYEEGDKRVVDAMQTGYPRFFVHRSIQKVRCCSFPSCSQGDLERITRSINCADGLHGWTLNIHRQYRMLLLMYYAVNISSLHQSQRISSPSIRSQTNATSTRPSK